MVYLNKTTSSWCNYFQSQTQSQISTTQQQFPLLVCSLILPRKQRWLDLGKPLHAPHCLCTDTSVCPSIRYHQPTVGHTAIYIAI